MASFGKAIGDSLKKLVFRELTVARVTHLSEHFEQVDFVAEALRGVRFAVGDKVQIAFEGGPRTYTPYSFDGARGALSVLVYLHGDGPSARWAKATSEGERVFAFGPRGSLALAAESGPIALFGDETSFGLARALYESRSAASGLSFVFEATHSAESNAVLDALQIPNYELVERLADDGHLPEVAGRLRTALARDATTRLVFSGKAPSIQALRARLKAEPAAHAGQLVKAYWAPGKRGLD
jgi:NADPH-dependent ferric siderophore reductase